MSKSVSYFHASGEMRSLPGRASGLSPKPVTSRIIRVIDMQRPVSLPVLKMACSDCNLRELCLPVDLSNDEMRQLNELSHLKRRFARGDYLYRSGDKFQSLFAIRSGPVMTPVR